MSEVDTPRVTFALFTFKQRAWAAEAVKAALAQTWPNLELIISDDHSPDGTFQEIERAVAGYAGPHTLILNRNEKNLGLIAHVNKVNAMATGEFIVVAAGDDISVPERTTVLTRAWLAKGRPMGSLHSAVTCIDESGRVLRDMRAPMITSGLSHQQLLVSSSLVIGASHAWSKSLVERFGPITVADSYEDLVIAYRSLIAGELIHVDEPLVRYRETTGMTAAVGDRRARFAKLWRAVSASFEQRAIDCEHIGNHALAQVCRREGIKWSVRAKVFGGARREALAEALRTRELTTFAKALVTRERLRWSHE